MKRLLGWTFNAAAAVSLALLAIYIIRTIYLVLFQPGWLTLRISTPVKTIRPVIIYAVLPIAWLIVRQRRRRTQAPRGFEPILPVEHPDQASNPLQ
jgi:uncharacterized membrane protein (DUF485 family)